MTKLLLSILTTCFCLGASAQGQVASQDVCLDISGTYELSSSWAGGVPDCSSGAESMNMWFKFIQVGCDSLTFSTAFKLKDGRTCENSSVTYQLKGAFYRLPSGTRYTATTSSSLIKIEYRNLQGQSWIVNWKLNPSLDLITDQLDGYVQTLPRSPIQ